MSDPADVVRRYYATVADLGSTDEALLELLDPDVRVVEHPNAITPTGGVGDLSVALAGFRAGKRLLSAQSFDLHEVLVAGDRVAVRATWRGTIGLGTEKLPAGAELVAHVASLLTVKDGRITDHETFDCYEPLPGG